eukprot:707104-Pleurochrysis_carterae.AAC.1
MRAQNSVSLRADLSSRPLRVFLGHARHLQANGDKDRAPPMVKVIVLPWVITTNVSILKQLHLADVYGGIRHAYDASRETIVLNKRHSLAPLRFLPHFLNL